MRNLEITGEHIVVLWIRLSDFFNFFLIRTRLSAVSLLIAKEYVLPDDVISRLIGLHWRLPLLRLIIRNTFFNLDIDARLWVERSCVPLSSKPLLTCVEGIRSRGQ